MDVAQLINIIKSMEDGALTPKEAKTLLTIISDMLEKIAPHVKKRFWRLIVHGIIGTLDEVRDNIDAID